MQGFLDGITALEGLDAIVLIVMLSGGGLILVYTLITGVPPMPTHPRVAQAMLRLAREGGADAPPPRVIYDLGCGWGRLAFALARAYPEARVIGIELSPLPWLFCVLRARIQRRPNLEIRYGNFLKAPLGDGDLFFCYLMITAMRRLQAKLDRDLSPGTLVISNSFAFPGWVPDEVEIVPTAMSAWVYRYRVTADGSHHHVSSVKP